MGSYRRDERGFALAMTTVLGLLIGLSAVVALSYADTVANRVRGECKLEKARAIAEAGLSFYVEEWRKSAGVLDIHDQNGDHRATTAAENPRIGVPVSLGGGTFELVAIEDAPFGSAETMPKLVDVRGTYDRMSYTWRALLGPNLVSPIQGSGTKHSQIWRNGSLFTAIGGGGGTVFANGNVTVYGPTGMINGDVRVQGSISQPSGGIITGVKDDAAPPITFPNVDAKIAAKITEAKGRAASYWTDPQTALVVDSALTAGETVNANTSTYGSGWPTQASMKSKSLALKGGVAHLPAGNYAFGRLWLEGTILTIKAPSGGGTIVLPDVYLVNNARLILDASDGPFTVIQPKNNSIYTASLVGYSTSNRNLSTNAWKWNGSAWVQATNGARGATNPLELKMNGTGSNNLWYKTGNLSSSDTYVKPYRGTTSGYDDWTIRDGAAFITVTPGSAAKGAEVWMQDGADLVLANTGQMLAGISSGHLATLQDPLTSAATIGAMTKNAAGLAIWSGGGNLARLNMDAGAGSGGASTLFYGLIYGEFQATLGVDAEYIGAFVGDSIDCSGTMRFDSRLAALATGENLNSQHVVVKFRVR